MQEGLKTVTFNESGQIMLDGKPLEHVKSYRVEKYTNTNEPAELTISMSVMAEIELEKRQQRMELMKKNERDFKKISAHTRNINDDKHYMRRIASDSCNNAGYFVPFFLITPPM